MKDNERFLLFLEYSTVIASRELPLIAIEVHEKRSALRSVHRSRWSALFPGGRVSLFEKRKCPSPAVFRVPRHL